MRPCINSVGYHVVNFSESGKIKLQYVHRLVAAAFFGPSVLQINHKDLNRINNNIDNLEYVTVFENILHAFKNNVRVGRTRLSAEQRQEIRNLRENGIPVKVISKKYQMSEPAIYEVLRGTTWRWESNK